MGALLPREFNANDAGERQDFSAIPADNYIIQAVKSEMVKCKESAKDPNGSFIKFEFEILQGKYKGRRLWDQLNVINKNTTTVKIAYEVLSEMQKACGKISLKNTEVLHGIPMKAKVVIKKGDANWPDKNEIKKYSKVDGESQETKVPVNDAVTGAAAEGEVKKKPWE